MVTQTVKPDRTYPQIMNSCYKRTRREPGSKWEFKTVKRAVLNVTIAIPLQFLLQNETKYRSCHRWVLPCFAWTFCTFCWNLQLRQWQRNYNRTAFLSKPHTVHVTVWQCQVWLTCYLRTFKTVLISARARVQRYTLSQVFRHFSLFI